MADKNPGRRISIRSVRKNPPDLSKLGRALIAVAVAEAEAKAQAQDAEAKKARERSDQTGSGDRS